MQRTLIIPPEKRLLKTEDSLPHRVCAYCRVSTDESDQRNSLRAQQQFFSNYFSRRSNWTNAGIFADEGLSGTSLEKRTEFNKLVALAAAGGADIILTKEVSRFSRNVRDLLNVIEELRSIGVYVWFLTDDINTECADYRERLTQIAANAEQESLRTSRRVRWGQMRQMEQGVVFGRREMFGYRIICKDGEQIFEQNPGEAEVVRDIFNSFASGESVSSISKRLNLSGLRTRNDKLWNTTAVLRILANEKYVGDIAQGKTYTPDPLTHKKKYNTGQAQKVYITDHHPGAAIVSRAIWDRAQSLLERGRKTGTGPRWASGKVFCALCGGKYTSYTRKLKTGTYLAWLCAGHHLLGSCGNTRLNDKVLRGAIVFLLQRTADERELKTAAEKITVHPDNILEVKLRAQSAPYFLKWSAHGRGADYTADFTLAVPEEKLTDPPNQL